MSRRARRGASAIEFALTMPAFVLLLALFTDYGWLFFQQANLDNAVHRGCRTGAVTDPLRESPEDAARASIAADLTLFGVRCDGGCVTRIETRGAHPSISMFCAIDAPYEPLFGLAATPARIQATTLMRYEWQDEMLELAGET